MRLIDADELTRQVFRKLHITNSQKDITDLIEQAPTIEPTVYEWNTESCKEISDKAKALDKALAVVRPKGEWINTGYKFKFNDELVYPTQRQCSLCNSAYPMFAEMNYCPNCGADMRGEKDD